MSEIEYDLSAEESPPRDGGGAQRKGEGWSLNILNQIRLHLHYLRYSSGLSCCRNPDKIKTRVFISGVHPVALPALAEFTPHNKN